MADDLPIGQHWPEQRYEVGREKIREYVAAIGIDLPWHREHEAARELGFEAVVAPPTFAAVYVAPSVASAMFDPAVGVFDPALGLAGYRFVQRFQSFEWGVPVCSGDTISTVATLLDGGERDGRPWRAFGSTSRNDDGKVVVRGRYEGVSPRAGAGSERRRPIEEAITSAEPSPADHSPGVGERLPPLRVTPDLHAPTRYAGASGDFTPFHLDAELARSIGLGGVILHGLHTFAVLARGVCEPLGGDPRILRALSARFRRPAFPAEELTTVARVVSVAAGSSELECAVIQRGRAVLGDGKAMLAL